MQKRWIVIGTLVALAGLAWAQDNTESGISIHKPLRSPTERIPYDPGRIIRMTLHDYVRGGMGGQKYETTGRHVTFGLPMKFLNLRMVFPNQSPLDIQTYTSWERNGDGAAGTIVNIHAPDGRAPTSMADSNLFLAVSTPFARPRYSFASPELIAAKQSGAVFDGYKMIQDLAAQTFWMRETYCGFDVFERDDARYWHIEAGTVEDVRVPDGVRPPFDHARVFGWPNGEGGYRFRVECKYSRGSATGFCSTDRAYNDYITVNYHFDGALLCQIDDVVEAHLNLLRRSVVDENPIKNERWRER
jgi:hypothetical protein